MLPKHHNVVGLAVDIWIIGSLIQTASGFVAIFKAYLLNRVEKHYQLPVGKERTESPERT